MKMRRARDDDSDDSEDGSNERKSATVCFLCRQRKQKCDRVLPSCGFCIKAKVNCQYVPQPGKRGLRAGYVTQLENRLDHLEAEVATLKRESPQHGAALLTALSGGVPSSAPSTAVLPPVTLSGWGEPPPKRGRFRTDTDAAVRDLATLSSSLLYSLAETWFKENHPWCPILSHEHIQNALASLPDPVESIDDIELRAVLALEISYSTQTIILGYEGRKRLAQYLRSDVLTEAISHPSLGSLRALIIIALMDYGSDNIPSTFSLMSIARRTCENLGLFSKVLSQIQDESPRQVGPPAVDTSGGEARMISITWCILTLDAVSTLGVSWRDVSAALVSHLSSVAFVSTPSFRDSFRAHMHLAAIGLQPVHEFLHDRGLKNYPKVDDATLQNCNEMYGNLISYVHNQPRMSYTILENGLVDFDPNLVHTETLVYATSVLIYQGFIDFETLTPEIAVERCLKTINEDMVTVIRSISDADAELNTPLLSHFLFVGARFKIVYCRYRVEPLDILFDQLMHTINMCGRRWSIARRLDIVLRAAAQEVTQGCQGSALPSDFWDLRKSHLDISEQLKEWVATWKSPVHDASLNGPFPWFVGK